MIRLPIILGTLAAVLLAGCQHKCCLNEPGCRPKPFQPPPPTGPMLLPPAGVPTTPGPAPSGALIPAVAPPDLRNYPPPAPANPSFKPAPEILYPDPLPGGSSSRMSPVPGSSSVINQNPQIPTTPEPPMARSARAGLPGFTTVAEGIAFGRKPELDGFESLKRSGFRTVIDLHGSSANVSAIRELAGQYGLEFIGIETTPEKLAGALEAFNAAVADKAVRPAYVFSENPIRAGALWYLHLRTVDVLNDDVARLRSRPLGLDGQDPDARSFELVIQKILESR